MVSVFAKLCKALVAPGRKDLCHGGHEDLGFEDFGPEALYVDLPYVFCLGIQAAIFFVAF